MLIQAGADFDVFVGETGATGRPSGDGGGYDHAVGFDAASLRGARFDYGTLRPINFSGS